VNESSDDASFFVSEGGMAAKYPSEQHDVVAVGPAYGSQANRLVSKIIPIACWRLDDIRFDFDSSVIKPDVENELKILAELVRQHPPSSKTSLKPGCPLSIFGHADPTGRDDYNKQLSGRRAKAIYALLTRRTDLWEQLYSNRFGNDVWGPPALRMMLEATNGPEPDLEEDMPELVTQHERSATKRTALFARYMEKLCGTDLKLDAGDFLARGEDLQGKGDYQGCGEFNPVLMFSQQEYQRLQDAANKQERDVENGPNRRVVLLIYRKGSRVSAQNWPCPSANEGVAGCKTRFWKDGEQRRSPAAERRTIEGSGDTFACRFYERLSRQSPCDHNSVVKLVPIAFDDALLGWVKDVDVRLVYEDGFAEQLKTNAKGVVMAKTSHGAFTDITYSRGDVRGSGRIFVLPPDARSETGCWQRLVNLGYVDLDLPPAQPPTSEHLALAVEEFQSEFGKIPNGELDDETRTLITHAHDVDKREWMNRDWQEIEVGPDATESKATVC
jgi:hypothetical protein